MPPVQPGGSVLPPPPPDRATLLRVYRVDESVLSCVDIRWHRLVFSPSKGALLYGGIVRSRCQTRCVPFILFLFFSFFALRFVIDLFLIFVFLVQSVTKKFPPPRKTVKSHYFARMDEFHSRPTMNLLFLVIIFFMTQSRTFGRVIYFIYCLRFFFFLQ